jgi:hypothetical protein
MSGVFLSYSRGDRALADRVIQGLRVLGVDVWWDQDMPGVDWQEELERQINELACVLVLWTPQSTGSKNVKDEARLGLRSEKLVNVLVGAPEPPFPFDRVNGLPLDGWTGREPHHGWTRVVQTIEPLIVRAGGAAAGEITGALARRDHALRQAQLAIGEAEHAFQDARAHETEAAATAASAVASVTRAEEQLHRMVEMRASSAVMRTAQQELEDARAASEAASQLQRAAKAALGEASHALTRAKTAQDRLVADAVTWPVHHDAPAPPPNPAAGVEAAAPRDRSPPVKRRRSWLPWVIVGGLAVIAALAWVFVSPSGGGSSRSSQGAASASVSAAGPAPNPAINGKWALEGASCSGAMAVAIHGDTIAAGGRSLKIASVDSDGTVNAGPDNNRYNYEVAGDTLTITSPNTDQTTYTRCPG